MVTTRGSIPSSYDASLKKPKTKKELKKQFKSGRKAKIKKQNDLASKK